MTNEELPDSDADLPRLVRRLESLLQTHEECFLCANPITNGRYTEEHVVPAWAQRRCNLWDQKLVLLNGTGIPYRQLTVPCCEDCNRNRLRPLEDSLSQSVLGGVGAVRALPRERVYLWLAKIFFGILYKELFLLLDRSEPGGRTIMTPEFLREYRTLRFLLQQVRETVRLEDFSPGSVFSFPMQGLPNPAQEWDLSDNVDSRFIGCRVGQVAMFAVLGDGGAQQYTEGEYSSIKDVPLHPLQFRELCARIAYRARLATRVPKYITLAGSPHRMHQLPLGGFSMKPLFEGVDPMEYAQFLSHYTDVPMEYLFEPPDKVRTYLWNEGGTPNFMNVAVLGI